MSIEEILCQSNSRRDLDYIENILYFSECPKGTRGRPLSPAGAKRAEAAGHAVCDKKTRAGRPVQYHDPRDTRGKEQRGTAKQKLRERIDKQRAEGKDLPGRKPKPKPQPEVEPKPNAKKKAKSKATTKKSAEDDSQVHTDVLKALAGAEMASEVKRKFEEDENYREMLTAFYEYSGEDFEDYTRVSRGQKSKSERSFFNEIEVEYGRVHLGKVHQKIDLKKTVKKMIDTLKKAPLVKTPLYRGITLYGEMPKEGDTFVFRGLNSFTTENKTAESFAVMGQLPKKGEKKKGTPHGVVFAVKPKQIRGALLKGITAIKGESEILCGEKAKFKISKVKFVPKPDALYFVELERI